MELDEGFKSLPGARDTCSSLLTQWLDDLQELWGEVGIPPEQQITRIKVVRICCLFLFIVLELSIV